MVCQPLVRFSILHQKIIYRLQFASDITDEDLEDESIFNGRIHGQYCGAGYVLTCHCLHSLCHHYAPRIDSITCSRCSYCGGQNVPEGPRCNFNVRADDGVDTCCKQHDAYPPIHVLFSLIASIVSCHLDRDRVSFDVFSRNLTHRFQLLRQPAWPLSRCLLQPQHGRLSQISPKDFEVRFTFFSIRIYLY
jgi:hypothetical protein